MTISADTIPVLGSIGELGKSYSAWLVDIWGVMHNGVRAFPAAVEATRRFRELIDAVNANDLSTARKINFELLPVVRATMTRVQGAVAAKQILKWQGVLPNSIVRLPLVEPDEAEIETIRGDLAEAGLVFS